MTFTLPEITPEARAEHMRWALELTQTPTAAGHEGRVIEWVQAWFDARPELAMRRDASGNLVLSFAEAAAGGVPVYLTAHLDHPAFVVDEVSDAGALALAFRGGVMDDYFPDAQIDVITHRGARLPARVVAKREGESLFPIFDAALDDPGLAGEVAPGDIARWRFAPAEVTEIDGVRCIATDACDDLVAAAAALAAMDVLRTASDLGRVPDLRVLLTRAEEIGFIGAIGACRDATIERGARVIALENSRSFTDSPIGGGPIVRVGDRISVFDPATSGDVGAIAEAISGAAAEPTASQKQGEMPAWRWQRKLMAGGACEASVFCAYGHAATCVCLPLGNYHNMADLTAVQAGTNTDRPRVGREYVAVSDYERLVDLLVGCAIGLTGAGEGAESKLAARLDDLWEKRSFVLREA